MFANRYACTHWTRTDNGVRRMQPDERERADAYSRRRAWHDRSDLSGSRSDSPIAIVAARLPVGNKPHPVCAAVLAEIVQPPPFRVVILVALPERPMWRRDARIRVHFRARRATRAAR